MTIKDKNYHMMVSLGKKEIIHWKMTFDHCQLHLKSYICNDFLLTPTQMELYSQDNNCKHRRVNKLPL